VPWHNAIAEINSTAGWTSSDYIGVFLSAGVAINCILAVFNLLPLAPLDGFKIWLGVLPSELARPLAQMERYGMLILMGLFFLGPFVFGVNVLGEIISPMVTALSHALTGV
jgi:Zn-dependent protease